MMKNLKRYKIQISACAVISIVAVAVALISGLIYDETTTIAVRIYCVIHPAFVMAAIALETLFLVSPAMMEETSPDVFFRCGTDTSIVAAIVCGVFIVATDKRDALVATITMPYIILTIVAFAVGLAVTRALNK